MLFGLADELFVDIIGATGGAVSRCSSLFGMRMTSDPLTPDDTADYLRVRLGRVGCTKELFTSDAIAMLHEAAAGSPRDTDRLATAALRAAARKKRKLVERDVLSRILQLDAEEAG
ncbi:hypothetical protein [Sorangium sp. So ce1151]|uniref:hypothetical protein n=1 Tax=Sorangium sp. So ce1151 TaxID=3133332 RepID=UPI003F5DF41F